MATERLHVYIEGYVQGVGFRFSTCEQAQLLNLSGWVRNLPDGRVEAEFEGDHADLESILNWCHQGPRGAEVTRVEADWEKGEVKHTGFTLRW